MTEKRKPEKSEVASDIKLVPFADFKTAVKKILSNSKKESDVELATFQASNLRKRQAKKKK